MNKMDDVYRMIEKECQRDSLVDLLGRWGLTENDWHTFMNGGLSAEDSELVVTDRTDQVQILKNALELAEKEIERLNAELARVKKEATTYGANWRG